MVRGASDLKLGSSGDALNDRVDPKDVPLLAAYGASVVTRITSRISFGKLGRGVVTGDMLGEIGGAYDEVFGEGKNSWKGEMGK
jgi:ATP-dependent NAD(P)H-hydrate dehydratase